MNDWRYRLAEQRGTLMAVAIFAVMFLIYVANHPAGFTPNVVQTASNKATLLAFVAVAQALVVITAGIDLSVGMVLVLTNCLASWLVVGTPLQTSLGILAVLATGLACGALNGLIVIYGRLQPIVTRYCTPAELDLMAQLAGLRLHDRWGGWQGEPFTADSRRHVSVWGR